MPIRQTEDTEMIDYTEIIVEEYLLIVNAMNFTTILSAFIL